MRSIVLFVLFFILQSALFKPDFCNSIDHKEEYEDFIYSDPADFVMSKNFAEEKMVLEKDGLKLFAIPLCNTYLSAPPDKSMNQPIKRYPITILIVLKNVSKKSIKIKHPHISGISNRNSTDDWGKFFFLFSKNSSSPKRITAKDHVIDGTDLNDRYKPQYLLYPGQSYIAIYDLTDIAGHAFEYFFRLYAPEIFHIKVVYKNTNKLIADYNYDLIADPMIWTGHLESNILTFKTVFDKNSNKPVKVIK